MDASGWLENVGNDCRYAARRLRQSPGFAAAAILTLALGIGANVAVFTVVQAVLLSPLPYPHPERLVRIYDDLRGSNSRDVGISAPELWDLRDRSDVFENISAIYPSDGNLTGGEKPERIELLATSTNYFTMLGARPELGRVYTVNDEQPGFVEGVVLSDAFWRRTFGGDPKALGKQIRVDGDLYTVLGVMPPEFRHPGRSLAGDVDVWTAAGFSGPPWPVPAQRSLRMIPGAMGRLRPGLTIAQAQARLDAFTVQLSSQYSNDYPAPARWGLRLVSLQEDLVGNMRTELFVLFGAVGCVLLIACVNLANLLLARSAGRQREIAVRRALGARKGAADRAIARGECLALADLGRIGFVCRCVHEDMASELGAARTSACKRDRLQSRSVVVRLCGFDPDGTGFRPDARAANSRSEPDRKPQRGQPRIGNKQTSEKHLARAGGRRNCAFPCSAHWCRSPLARLLAPS
jgi:predicted permease